MSSPEDSVTEYHRRLRHRQTTVIGGLLATMAVLSIVCLAVWSGMLPAPYEPGFSTPAPTETLDPVACPPEGAATVDLALLTANVYNGTDTAGLAGGVAGVLSDAGITVANTADWPKGAYGGDVMITASQAGLANAYTIAQLFTGDVRVTLDETVDAADATVSVVLGDAYKQGVLAKDQITALAAGTPITAPTGCVPATS